MCVCGGRGWGGSGTPVAEREEKGTGYQYACVLDAKGTCDSSHQVWQHPKPTRKCTPMPLRCHGCGYTTQHTHHPQEIRPARLLTWMSTAAAVIAMGASKLELMGSARAMVTERGSSARARPENEVWVHAHVCVCVCGRVSCAVVLAHAHHHRQQCTGRGRGVGGGARAVLLQS